MLVWIEDAGSQTRLRSLSGVIAEAKEIDHPAIATDGQSFLVTWQQSAVTVSAAHLPSGNTFTFATDRTADPVANVVWTGLEYAIAMPQSVVFLRDGAVARTTSIGDSTAALAAVNGNSLLIVRRTSKLVSMLPYPFDLISKRLMPVFAAQVIGNGTSRSRELFISEKAHAASVAGGGDGYLLVCKEEGVLRALRIDQNGDRVNSAEVIARNIDDGGATALVATRDGWLVLWDDAGATFAAEVDANGRKVGEIVTVAAEGRSPAVVTIGEDRFRVFYRTATSIDSRVIGNVPPPRRRAVR